MEELFKKVSIEENCSYNVVYENSYSPFVMSPFTRRVDGVQAKSITLEIKYNNHIIKVEYKLNNDRTGILNCKLGARDRLPKFKITNKSHYWRFFNRKKNILKIDCDEPKFKTTIEEKLNGLGIEQIARNTQFEPIIVGANNNNNFFEIKTSFHLAFSAKKDILRPLIELYKYFVDYSINNETK